MEGQCGAVQRGRQALRHHGIEIKEFEEYRCAGSSAHRRRSESHGAKADRRRVRPDRKIHVAGRKPAAHDDQIRRHCRGGWPGDSGVFEDRQGRGHGVHRHRKIRADRGQGRRWMEGISVRAEQVPGGVDCRGGGCHCGDHRADRLRFRCEAGPRGPAGHGGHGPPVERYRRRDVLQPVRRTFLLRTGFRQLYP